MQKEHTEQCKEINENTDKRVLTLERHVDEYTRRLDRHLEIYAQNGKELKALQARVSGVESTVDKIYDMGEALLQQISGVGSDVKNMQIKFNDYTTSVAALQTDKSNRDSWITWFLRMILGALIMAVLIAIGVNMK